LFLSIDTHDPRSIYQQVADGIKALIARGELAEGAALPPVRQLAADLGVNLNTIATAYRELQREGLLTVKHGSGAMVASRTLRKALTELVLAGLPKSKILRLVMDELRMVMKGAR